MEWYGALYALRGRFHGRRDVPSRVGGERCGAHSHSYPHPPTRANGIPHMSGGIDEDDRLAMEAARKEYSLFLRVAAKLGGISGRGDGEDRRRIDSVHLNT